jgi:hypothetical protein
MGVREGFSIYKVEIWLLGFICHLKIGIWEFQKPVSVLAMETGFFY